MDDIRKVEDTDPTYAMPYEPNNRETHQFESLWQDIPMRMSHGPDGLWLPTGGLDMLPVTAARLAQHAELVGYTPPDGAAAQIRRVALPRGAFRWQDVRAEVPDVDPVDAVHVAAAAVLTPAEKASLIDRLRDDLAGMEAGQ